VVVLQQVLLEVPSNRNCMLLAHPVKELQRKREK